MTGEGIGLLIFGIILLCEFIYFVYQIEKSDEVVKMHHKRYFDCMRRDGTDSRYILRNEILELDRKAKDFLDE